jgi:Domain of unknown function (DUF1864)
VADVGTGDADQPSEIEHVVNGHQGARYQDSATTFGSWIRTAFVEINTELEELYWEQENRSSVAPGRHLKSALLAEGEARLAALSVRDVTGGRFDERFALLGDVGLFMAACRRHEIIGFDAGAELENASKVALQLGASLGTAPRFLTAHMETHNRAFDGRYRTFTAYEAERLFLDANTRSVFAYMRAADALIRTVPLGVSHPVTYDLLVDAAGALRDALALNRDLSVRLDVDRFFFCVRPYYKPHRAGRAEFRGANAGDFAAFTEIDTLLGLCSMAETSYAQVVLEKIPYLVPAEQGRLRDSLRTSNLLDAFLDHAAAADQVWFQRNAAAFLDVVTAHGAAATHHHDELVGTFIRRPSTAISPENRQGLTASGPPLDVLIASLERLRDRRLAAPRDDIATRHDDVAALRALVTEISRSPPPSPDPMASNR